ncbi:MAG: response regulator transcription factor [Campylobacterales bacterium]|nr:response regulator transcription factor [Campylobacterales bacterium]
MIIFFSQDYNLLQEWKVKFSDLQHQTADAIETVINIIATYKENPIVVCDYDSVASEINKIISSDQVFKNTIVLERIPAVVTGKMLISHGIKAYGNSRMLPLHFKQMIDAVGSGKSWTYPELTAALIKSANVSVINPEALQLLDQRLTSKEKEVVELIMQGFSNEILAHKLGITTRTVKAHISSIFEKLHVSDRVSLILLLK